ncbi:unnamed protein product, partial [Sphacelaria rigidula]
MLTNRVRHHLLNSSEISYCQRKALQCSISNGVVLLNGSNSICAADPGRHGSKLLRYTTSTSKAASYGGTGRSVPPSGGESWHPGSRRGGSEWQQHSGSGRSGASFFHTVPITWLAAAALSVADLTLGVSALERENFPQLVQRCDFRIANATEEDPGDLSSLYELLEWVHYSLDTNGVTALPLMLNAGIIKVALRGATSPNAHVSAVCHDMLMALSFNTPVAEMMARDPELREELVREVCRRVQPAIYAASQHQLALAGGPLNHDDGRGESEQSESSFTTEGHFRQSSPSPSPLDAPRETSETLPKDTKHFGRRRTSLRGGRWVGGVKRPPENVAVPKDSSEDELSTPTSITDSGEDESAAADDVVYISMDVLKVNMLNASNALRALRNVLEASRLASSFPRTGSAPAHSTSGGDDGGSTGNTRKVPWPISMLYGKQRSTGDGEGMGQSAGERLEWPVDVSVVDAITRLLAAVSTFPAIQPASPTPGEEPDALHGDAQYHGEVDQKLVEEVMWAVGPVFQEVRQETSALLLEISSDAQMVELLMRRNYLDTLLAQGVPGQRGPGSLFYWSTLDSVINLRIFGQQQDTVGRRASSAITNITEEYKRRHPMVDTEELSTQDWKEVATRMLLDYANNSNPYESWGETPAEQLGEEDRPYVEQ